MMAPSVFDQPPKMRNLSALLVLLSIYNGYPLEAMDQEHSNMNFISKCGHYWRGNGGGDILVANNSSHWLPDGYMSPPAPST